MFIKSFPLLFSILLALSATAQKKDSTKLNIKFNVGIGAVTTEYFSHAIVIDPTIAIQRNYIPFNSYYTGLLTDQPHEHGSIFTNFSSKTTFKPGYTFYANLLMEYRGESYGANDLNNAVVLPQMYGRITDTISIKNKPLGILVHIGDLFQYKLNQGLQIYNVDLQAVILRLDYLKYTFKIVHIPDHSKGIGLGLEEVFSFNLGIKEQAHQFNFAFDLNSNVPFTNPIFSTLLPNKYYKHLSLDYKFSINKNSNLYFQFGSRQIEQNFRANTSAFLIGSEIKFSNKKLALRINPEIRYYSRRYNLGYFIPDNFFRDNNNPNHYSNTVGRYLYPLKNYDYSFSQWAVFTEYQNRNVLGLGTNIDIDIKLNKKLGFLFNFDYLGIDSKDNFFNYFFYTWNFYYQPVKGLYIKTLLTNKTMNLDAHFQTFYMTKYPSIGLELRKTLNPIW